MTTPSLELQIQTLPDSPGVYQYYDKEEKILYVGKAKNLKKRVSSYFNKIHDTAKTNVLVKKIVTIKHIVVPTESDALLLENNLIKTLQPRYNVLLRDDKSYPWICIKKEPFSSLNQLPPFLIFDLFSEGVVIRGRQHVWLKEGVESVWADFSVR